MSSPPRLGFLLGTLMVGCTGGGGLMQSTGDALLSRARDHHETGEDVQASSDLEPTDPVSAAVDHGCSTTTVWGLATQLVAEIGCMQRGALKRIDGNPGLELGPATFPYLQSSAADALARAQRERGVTMSINSGLRTLPQQYLLYRWYQANRCGIAVAAPPGASNHESALAVDLRDNAGWRSAMQQHGYRWLGAGDPVHFDYVGDGAIEMSGLSIRAFQQLWNRNNANDPVAEDGRYGSETESRLVRSPIGGFAVGASCGASAEPEP